MEMGRNPEMFLEQPLQEEKDSLTAFKEWLDAGVREKQKPEGRGRPEEFQVLEELEKKLFGMPHPFPETKKPVLEILKWLRQEVSKETKNNTNFLMALLELFEKKARQQGRPNQKLSQEEVKALDSDILMIIQELARRYRPDDPNMTSCYIASALQRGICAQAELLNSNFSRYGQEPKGQGLEEKDKKNQEVFALYEKLIFSFPPELIKDDYFWKQWTNCPLSLLRDYMRKHPEDVSEKVRESYGAIN